LKYADGLNNKKNTSTLKHRTGVMMRTVQQAT